MKKEIINSLIKEKRLRIKSIDKNKARSLTNSSEKNAEVILEIRLTDKTATIIFREIYESIRQLGEALWILGGYEPNPIKSYHETCLLILKDMEITDKVKLNHLDRYRKIRNDSNYQGSIISENQAKELVEFWNKCGKEIIKNIQDKFKEDVSVSSTEEEIS